VTQPKRKPQSGRYPRAPREDDECVDAPSGYDLHTLGGGATDGETVERVWRDGVLRVLRMEEA